MTIKMTINCVTLSQFIQSSNLKNVDIISIVRRCKMLLISIVKWKVAWDKTLASARNVDITAFLDLLFCLEWEKYQKKYHQNDHHLYKIT